MFYYRRGAILIFVQLFSLSLSMFVSNSSNVKIFQFRLFYFHHHHHANYDYIINKMYILFINISLIFIFKTKGEDQIKKKIFFFALIVLEEIMNKLFQTTFFHFLIVNSPFFHHNFKSYIDSMLTKQKLVRLISGFLKKKF